MCSYSEGKSVYAKQDILQLNILRYYLAYQSYNPKKYEFFVVQLYSTKNLLNLSEIKSLSFVHC